MLGCQDFCGYYDWSFAYLRKQFGPDAAPALWGDIKLAQEHYTKAGLAKGLRGLYEVWCGTGEDEQFDWSFILDEAGNVLRWDMKQCPSKGFLLQNDLHGDEDYCDHCMGWIVPMLQAMGGEIVAHEHNHAGQCWAEIRMKERASGSLCGHDDDITQDPLWQRGSIERWEADVKLPVLPAAGHASDPVEVIRDWFRDAASLTVLGRGPSACDAWTQGQGPGPTIVTDPTYATRDVYAGEPCGV